MIRSINLSHDRQRIDDMNRARDEKKRKRTRSGVSSYKKAMEEENALPKYYNGKEYRLDVKRLGAGYTIDVIEDNGTKHRFEFASYSNTVLKDTGESYYYEGSVEDREHSGWKTKYKTEYVPQLVVYYSRNDTSIAHLETSGSTRGTPPFDFSVVSYNRYDKMNDYYYNHSSTVQLCQEAIAVANNPSLLSLDKTITIIKEQPEIQFERTPPKPLTIEDQIEKTIGDIKSEIFWAENSLSYLNSKKNDFQKYSIDINEIENEVNSQLLINKNIEKKIKEKSLDENKDKQLIGAFYSKDIKNMPLEHKQKIFELLKKNYYENPNYADVCLGGMFKIYFSLNDRENLLEKKQHLIELYKLRNGKENEYSKSEIKKRAEHFADVCFNATHNSIYVDKSLYNLFKPNKDDSRNLKNIKEEIEQRYLSFSDKNVTLETLDSFDEKNKKLFFYYLKENKTRPQLDITPEEMPEIFSTIWDSKLTEDNPEAILKELKEKHEIIKIEKEKIENKENNARDKTSALFSYKTYLSLKYYDEKERERELNYINKQKVSLLFYAGNNKSLSDSDKKEVFLFSKEILEDKHSFEINRRNLYDIAINNMFEIYEFSQESDKKQYLTWLYEVRKGKNSYVSNSEKTMMAKRFKIVLDRNENLKNNKILKNLSCVDTIFSQPTRNIKKQLSY